MHMDPAIFCVSCISERSFSPMQNVLLSLSFDEVISENNSNEFSVYLYMRTRFSHDVDVFLVPNANMYTSDWLTNIGCILNHLASCGRDTSVLKGNLLDIPPS